MGVLSATFTSASNTEVVTTYDDGRPNSVVPVNVDNRDYREVVIFGTPAAFVPPVLSAAEQAAVDLRAAGVTIQTISQARYLDTRGDSSLLDAIDTDVDIIVISSGLDLDEIAALIP